MTFIDTTVLATAWFNQPALGQRPERTLLIGAATLTVRSRFDGWSFTLDAHSTTVTDNPAETMIWLAEDLAAGPSRLLLWRAEDIVVPSLLAVAETARDGLAGAKLLRELDRAFTRQVEDVAQAYGGSKARSFDAIAHAHGLPFVVLARSGLAEAHRLGDHGSIRDHLVARVKATWRLWLRSRPDTEPVIEATESWLAASNVQVQL